MSSLPVAARPATGLPRIPLGFVMLVVALAVIVGVAIGANAFAKASLSTTATNPTAAQAAARHQPLPGTAALAPALASYRQIAANLAAAEERHDFAAQFRFSRQLDGALTPAVLGALYTEHAQLVANLEASVERHDTHSRALISSQLSQLCGPAAVKAQLDFCN
jgi:hypothetical protein